MHSSPPPWVVPRERKPRGMQLGGGDCYDPHEGSFYISRGREAITHNRFSQLTDYNDRVEEVLQLKNAPDFLDYSISSQEKKKKNQEDDYFVNFEEFINKNLKNFNINAYFIDEYNSYTYSNKNYFCSGYFPDYISTSLVDSNDNNNNGVSKNFYPYDTLKNSCLDDNIKFSKYSYQPNFKNGKYRKQISNLHSRYNNSYFYKMYSSYKICKKILGCKPKLQ